MFATGRDLGLQEVEQRSLSTAVSTATEFQSRVCNTWRPKPTPSVGKQTSENHGRLHVTHPNSVRDGRDKVSEWGHHVVMADINAKHTDCNID